MSTEETRYQLAYSLKVMPSALTREEVKQAKKIVPGDDYCQAAVILALLGPGALVVKSCDARRLTKGAFFPQGLFELWLLWTRQLAADPELPHAMKVFLERVLENYKVECAR